MKEKKGNRKEKIGGRRKKHKTNNISIMLKPYKWIIVTH
jgi:hypothetical protein